MAGIVGYRCDFIIEATLDEVDTWLLEGEGIIASLEYNTIKTTRAGV